MTNITYRSTTTPTVPTTSSVKGSPLTNTELDGNFKSISNDINSKANVNGTNATGTWGIDITGNSGSATNISGVNNVVHGGTGQNTLPAKGVLVGNGTNPIGSVISGSEGDVLTVDAAGNWVSLPSAAASGLVISNSSDNTEQYLMMSRSVSGGITTSYIHSATTKLSYNPSTGVFTVPKLSGDGSSITNINIGNISTGTLPVSRGGTGIASFTVGDLIYCSTTNTLTKLPKGDSTKVLIGGDAPSWGQLNLSTQVSNTLSPANGGTGNSAYSIGDILYASGTSSLSKISAVSSGNSLISNGVNSSPSWGKIGLTTHVTGTLPVSNGGTGTTTLTSNGLLVGNGTNPVSSLTPGAAGSSIQSNGTTWVVIPKTTIPVTDGGTGKSTFNVGSLLVGNGASTLTEITPTGLDSGKILKVNSAGNGWEISSPGISGLNVTDDTTSTTLKYIGFYSVTSGVASDSYVSSTNLGYNPSTGVLYSKGFVGIVGNVKYGSKDTTSATSGNIDLSTGATSLSGDSGSIRISSGNSSGNSGDLVISTGTGITTGGITIDVGSGSTVGKVSIGGVNASSVELPSSRTKIGSTSIVGGGAVSVTLPSSTGTLALKSDIPPASTGAITIGSTSIALGGTATSVGGLNDVSSTTFHGNLIGNASTATTATTASDLALGAIVPITKGGTGANNLTEARTNLGLVIGTNVQAYSLGLSELSNQTGTTTLGYYRKTGQNTVALELPATVLTNIGGQASSAGLTNYSAILANASTGFIQKTGVNAVSLIDSPIPIANGGTGASTRQPAINGLVGSTTSGTYLRGDGTNVSMSTIQASDVPTLNQNTTGTASNVTGTVGLANGGTGATSALGARTNIGAQVASNALTSISTISSDSVIGFAYKSGINTWSLDSNLNTGQTLYTVSTVSGGSPNPLFFPTLNKPVLRGQFGVVKNLEYPTSGSTSLITIKNGEANYFTVTLTKATTFAVDITPAWGVCSDFILEITNGGNYNSTWFANIAGAGGVKPSVLNLTPNGRDIVRFYSHNGGATWNYIVLAKDVY